MILLIDNWDSFVYNLARYVTELGFESQVVRTNDITIEEIHDLSPSHIILSPGPCTPNEAGISLDVVKHFCKKIPILGVCLGHQAIAQAFGGEIKRAYKPMHGKSALIMHDHSTLFKDIPELIKVARYHSLIADPVSIPDCLHITAMSAENEIMAVQHKHLPVFGVQFHPESVLTEHGYDILQNFLNVKTNGDTDL